MLIWLADNERMLFNRRLVYLIKALNNNFIAAVWSLARFYLAISHYRHLLLRPIAALESREAMTSLSLGA